MFSLYFFLNVILDGDFLVIATDGLVQSSVHCYRVGLKVNQGKKKKLKIYIYTYIMTNSKPILCTQIVGGGKYSLILNIVRLHRKIPIHEYDLYKRMFHQSFLTYL